MKLSELITAARQRTSDEASPYLWSDAEWTRFANEAQRDACRRSRLLLDSSTEEIARISLTAGEPVYDLDSRVIFVRRARVEGQSQPLSPISHQDLDEIAPGWEDEVSEPRAMVIDFDTGKFRPYPTPKDDGIVRLTVQRLPLASMVKPTDTPEIHERFHEGLLEGMLERAYRKQDSQTRDKTREAEHAANFTREFGPPSSAIDETWLQTKHGIVPNEGNY
jgi:hypothetical protein